MSWVALSGPRENGFIGLNRISFRSGITLETRTNRALLESLLFIALGSTVRSFPANRPALRGPHVLRFALLLLVKLVQVLEHFLTIVAEFGVGPLLQVLELVRICVQPVPYGPLNCGHQDGLVVFFQVFPLEHHLVEQAGQFGHVKIDVLNKLQVVQGHGIVGLKVVAGLFQTRQYFTKKSIEVVHTQGKYDV
ncbi:hypothetical protein BpHYR1_050686 [Brachionus plicatilis]|uniref:Uncharacterized protein n=1 Tax=Brachionus plicatilis TaxID=10195 RepID=A0A3M7RB94_BRAPC|nr:hypothetical protein BpHYR1_050686 [Brachionus plicatilis]